MTRIELVVNNPTGLHARPAAVIAKKAGSFACKVTLAANGKTADAKSLLGIMGLGVTDGTTVTLTADGPDEQECIAALSALMLRPE